MKTYKHNIMNYSLVNDCKAELALQSFTHAIRLCDT